MGKRKRGSGNGSSLGVDLVDEGLGATLARLKDDGELPSSATSPRDDGSWTVVGAKKRRREEAPRKRVDHDLEEEDDDSRNKPSSTEPTESLPYADVDSAIARNDHGVAPPNPFSTNKSGSDSLKSPPANPFSTQKRDEDETSTGREHQGRHGDQGKRDRKKERGQDRKNERDYPAIQHSHHSRPQSHVKITDLQALILYLLADGTAPQWVSVKNRAQIRQVVVLMVPGLELGMFNGDIALESSQTLHATSVDEEHIERDSDSGRAAKEAAPTPKRLRISPDDFYPASLKPDRLPAALKPLADIFPHVWPVMAIGERRGGRQWYRVHSPIHTMLTSQVPRTQEQRQLKKNPHHKGPIPENTKNWENKRTRITEYITNLVDQEESEYVIHPAWYTTPEAKDIASQRRKEAHKAVDDGWVDSNVQTIEDGDISEGNIEEGSVTAGRTVLAVDCEMCKATNDELVLTRISLLSWDGKVVLDKLVKPDLPIKDYLTQ